MEEKNNAIVIKQISTDPSGWSTFDKDVKICISYQTNKVVEGLFWKIKVRYSTHSY